MTAEAFMAVAHELAVCGRSSSWRTPMTSTSKQPSSTMSSLETHLRSEPSEDSEE